MPNPLRVLLFSALTLSAERVCAEEGMWLPQQIPDLAAELRGLGFAGDPSEFADLTGQPMGAVVSLGGCTGSFVSPEGLVVTNHHCAVSALQYNSSPERNRLLEGHLAATRGDELWNGPGTRLLVTVSEKDVTEEINGGIDPRLDDLRRFALLDRHIKERTAACEASGLRCRVASFFGGLRYFEIAQMEILDVRLVYAPAQGIGRFGGETDNWRWPRHTGDWSFFRAYVGPDGKPAPHAKDNLPYRPKRWLGVQPAGVKEGELVLVAGYPGRTERHRTAAELRQIVGWRLPRQTGGAVEQIAILEALVKDDPELTIKAASRLRGLNNGLTKRRGVLEGLEKGGIPAREEQAEKDLLAWIGESPARVREYGDALPGLASLEAQAQKTRERNAVFDDLLSASSMLSAGQTAYALALEKAKADDLSREAEYQQRNWNRIRDSQERAQRTMDARIDRALLRWALRRAASLPADQRVSGVDKTVGLTAGMSARDSDAAIEDALEKLYSRTRIGDRELRLGLLSMTPAELAAQADSMLHLAIALDPLRQEIRDARQRREGAESRFRPRYMKARLARAGGLVAPDANGTLRVTFGTVKGRPGLDGTAWLPFTTLRGIEEKHTGRDEFVAPPAELAAIAALRRGERRTPYLAESLGDVPVDFLSTVDTTGGNSGSPTLNGKGELVGLLFDGTYDTVASDYLYDTVSNRSIHVDVRYLLWVMSEVDGARDLLREMGVE